MEEETRRRDAAAVGFGAGAVERPVKVRRLDTILDEREAIALATTTPSSTNVLTPSASKSSGSGLRAATRCTAASLAAMI